MGIVVCAVWALYCCVKVGTFDLFSTGKEKEILGFVIYVAEVLVKMRDLLKVEPNGCSRLRLKSLISFIIIWLLRKFERTWKCENIYIYIYIYYGFNNLCSSCLRFMWIERETSTTFWSCFFCIFVLFFVLRGERQFEQKYLFTPNFNKGGLRKTNGTYYRWVKWYFSNHG